MLGYLGGASLYVSVRRLSIAFESGDGRRRLVSEPDPSIGGNLLPRTKGLVPRLVVDSS